MWAVPAVRRNSFEASGRETFWNFAAAVKQPVLLAVQYWAVSSLVKRGCHWRKPTSSHYCYPAVTGQLLARIFFSFRTSWYSSTEQMTWCCLANFAHFHISVFSCFIFDWAESWFKRGQRRCSEWLSLQRKIKREKCQDNFCHQTLYSL